MLLPPIKHNILVVLSLLCFCCSSKKEEIKPNKPNVIFLLTDDQRWDALGAMGNSIIKTPNLDKMASNGFLFTNAYVTTSICCVSRASILSGQYESRHGINGFRTSFTKDAFNKTYPAILKENGYTIGFIGKYGVGNPENQPKNSFDYWKGVNKHQPDYENRINDSIYHYTDLVEGYINDFLNTADKKPFCLSVSFKAPHVQDGDTRQFIPVSRYDDYYESDSIPQPETANPKYWESFPDFFKTDQNIGRERWKLRFETPEQYQESVKNYFRLITGVDDVIGNLLAKLKTLNLDKNTVIVFIGDNGMFLGEHGLAGKWYGYEESIRVPLIIYDPRSNPNKSKIDEIALNIDIAPTILGLAGIDVPNEMQGIDLIEDLKSNKAKRNSFFYEHTFLGSPQLPKVEGVVSTKIKYMKYIEHNYEELYDLTKDPHETTNLVNDPNYKIVLKKQRIIYNSLKQKAK